MKSLVLLLCCMSLMACSSVPSPASRQANAATLAAARGWQPWRIPAGQFELLSYLPPATSAQPTLVIYLEGDGFAWRSRATPSADPSPIDPIGLKLALASPGPASAYLARPCQYVDAATTDCPSSYWTDQRFSEAVIAAMDIAVSRLKNRFAARHLVLVGYSGGANIAALLAMRRNDVTLLVSVAGNLDHAGWTRHHAVRPLKGSLNAAANAEALREMPQKHFIGARDSVIPVALAKQWPQALRGEHNRNLIIIPDFDHTCCWAEQWPRLFPIVLPPLDSEPHDPHGAIWHRYKPGATICLQI